MSKKILIVEDEGPLRENLVTLLSEEDYDVISADNGFSAEELALLHTPDLILSDIVMKGRSGYDLLKILQQHESTKKIPIIFLSARVEREHVRLAMELGADDYLLKPYRRDEVLSAIEGRLKKFALINEENSGKKTDSNEVEKLQLDGKIFIKQKEDIGFIKVSDIKFIEADNQYTILYLSNGKNVLLHKPLKEWELKLPENNFFKVNRSTIICIDQIEKIEKWFNSTYKIKLYNEVKEFTVSKRLATKLRIFN